MKKNKRKVMANIRKKSLKRKAKLKNRKKPQPGNSSIKMAYIQEAIKNDVHTCLVSGDFEQGMVDVMVFKEAFSNVMVLASFIIDLYCLGVKNTFIKPGTMEQYEHLINNPGNSPFSQEDAKKLIEEAVAYAEELGFKPHHDFKKTFKIFDNVDSSKSIAKFTFGKDGKPFFIAGPRDSPKKCSEIIKILRDKFGQDGHHFMMPNPDIEIFDKKAGEWAANRLDS